MNFKDPKMISNEIYEPDVLQISFLLPDLIIDAETGQKLELEESGLNYFVQLST